MLASRTDRAAVSKSLQGTPAAKVAGSPKRLAIRRWATTGGADSRTEERNTSMSTAELDRSVLDAKDREELHAIAGAMGVNAPTRMRKAELIDAILAAA